jgi:TRAP-type C4-dicarboxylate transport system permease small subunit
MYIVAIAWMYVVLMMSITEHSAAAGVATFLLYGALPLSIILYLMDTPRRKRNRLAREKAEQSKAAASDHDQNTTESNTTES